ncbi:MAG: glycosyltransferase family 4 protein [Candidatus Syntropharchaeales archaeon]
MRLAYFVDEYPPFFRGGLGTYAMEITRELIKLGHDISVFSRNVDRAPTRDVWGGVEVHRPLIPPLKDVTSLFTQGDVRNWDIEGQAFYAETFYYNLLSASKLVNQLVILEKRDYDLVISHDWLAAIGGIVASKAIKKPFIFHFHSTEGGRTGNGSSTIKEIERIASQRADMIVTVSYAMRSELVRLGADEEKIRVVYNGVDPEKYNEGRLEAEEVSQLRERLGMKEDELMILFIGRLNWVKGADTLLQAMPLILREVPQAKLVILGRGEQEKLLMNMASNLGVEDRVVFEFKYVSEDERILLYAASDVVVFPSKYEPFGIVCTEAMSMSRPVIVGAKGTSGFREQIVPYGEEINGFHIDPNDPHDIAKYVVEVLKNDDLRVKMGKNGRNRVLEMFTWERIAKETIKVYEEVVG